MISEHIYLSESRTWQGLYKNLVGLQIKHRAGDANDGYGTWFYYITIPERNCPDFESLWLPGRLVKFLPESNGHIMYDYFSLIAGEVDWHGGITYYAKHGHDLGFRAVEMGCDYSHLWDMEAGFENITFDLVQSEAFQTADQLIEKLNLHPIIRKNAYEL